MIDVAAGDKIPRKGGPGITRSTFLSSTKSIWPRMWAPIWGDGPRCQADARGAAVCFHEFENRTRVGRCGFIYREERRSEKIDDE